MEGHILDNYTCERCKIYSLTAGGTFSLMIFLSQESLKKVLQEKLEAIQRLTEIEVR